MFKQTVLAAGMPALPKVPMLAAVVLVILVVFGWQITGLHAIQRGDFIDENALKLKSAGMQEVGLGLEQVAAMHLFGDVAANAVVAPPPSTDLPKTDLKLVLVGAMTDSDPQKASALIEADQQTRRFYIGDNIPGGAVLHEVLADSVVLKRDNRYETLFFPKAGDTATPARPRVSVNPTPGRSGPAGALNSAPTGRPSVEKGMSLRDRLQRGPGAGQPSGEN